MHSPRDALASPRELRLQVGQPCSPQTSPGRSARNVCFSPARAVSRSVSSTEDDRDPGSKRLPPRQVSGLTQVSRLTSFESMAHSRALAAIADDWEEEEGMDHCGSRWVMREGNFFRRAWNVIIALLLVYTATVFLYRVAFVECRIPVDQRERDRDAWTGFDDFVNICFWADLILNFFFTYQDVYGREVDSVRLVAHKYLLGMFWINILACIPPKLTESIVRYFHNAIRDDQPSGIGFMSPALRLTRIQRASRLARLLRLGRLARLIHLRHGSNTRLTWFQNLRGVRIVNFIVGLMLAVHFLACGWYLCAALHDDYEETWVARRSVDADGTKSLLDQGPLEQWFHAMYFVLTVFTTVGFGDMSAMTIGEIVYVAFTMVVGAVVHSIIISHVVTIVTSQDRTETFVRQQQDLVEAFAAHAELDQESRRHMREWITLSARNWMSHRFDQEEMKRLLTCNFLPRWLLGRLPEHLFREQLIRNRFLAPCPGIDHVPPRLPLLLALAVHKGEFSTGEVVYQMHDVAWSVYLVLSGVFAHVGLPGPKGGIDMEQGLDEPLSVTGKCDTKHCSQKSQPKTPSRSRFTEWVQMATTKSHSVRDEPQRLYPYRLYSASDYFGEAELLPGKTRQSTLRCESAGVALVLRKESFVSLQEEFPRFGEWWRKASALSERTRERRLRKLTRGLPYRHLAAVRIQRWILPKLACSGRHRLIRSRQERSSASSIPSNPSSPTLLVNGRPSLTEKVRVAGAAAEPASCPNAAAESSAGQRSPGSSPPPRGAGSPQCQPAAPLLIREMREMRAFMEGMRSSIDALRGDVDSLRHEVRGGAQVRKMVEPDTLHI